MPLKSPKHWTPRPFWLGNADYNADITTANSGSTLIDTGEGVVTITFGSRNADKTYATDPTGIANNEDSYTMHADSDKMQNDRVLGNILLTKVDLDAARYLAAGKQRRYHAGRCCVRSVRR